MRTSIVLLAFVLISIASWAESAKILAIYPITGKSHHIFLRSITDDLAARGHQVTIYTGIPSGKNITNIKEIPTKNTIPDFMKALDFNALREFGQTPIFGLPGLLLMGLEITERCLDDPVLAELIESDEKFDLVLLEAYFLQEALVAFGHKFQAPVISLNPFSTYFCIDEFAGNPFGTAYLPSVEVPYTDKMNFFQRVHNTLRTLIFSAVNTYYYIPKQNELIKKYFKYPGSQNIPPVSEMLYNISLVIVNSQFSTDFQRAWVPNIIAAPGPHISPVRKPLPKDLQEFLDGAEHGFVYFSFGSVVPSEQMPQEMKQAFIDAFAKLRQRVLWKLPVDNFPGLPKNVKISKWLPQHDILAHPKCLTFITHGGLLSQTEAVYFGVPFIGIAFFADQGLNINRAVDRGFAIHLNQNNITKESVYWVVNEIITKPSYRANAKKYSRIFKDNPMSPKDTAAYWIEYVLRHDGAPHMQSPGRKLPYYQYFLLDVFAFLILTSFSILFIAYKIVSLVCIKTFCKQSRKQASSSKKKN